MYEGTDTPPKSTEKPGRAEYVESESEDLHEMVCVMRDDFNVKIESLTDSLGHAERRAQIAESKLQTCRPAGGATSGPTSGPRGGISGPNSGPDSPLTGSGLQPSPAPKKGRRSAAAAYLGRCSQEDAQLFDAPEIAEMGLDYVCESNNLVTEVRKQELVAAMHLRTTA